MILKICFIECICHSRDFQLSSIEKLLVQRSPATLYHLNYKKLVTLALTMGSSILIELKINVTISNVRLRSILNINKTINFTQKIFLYTKLDFTQSQKGFSKVFQKDTFKKSRNSQQEKPIKITGNDIFLLFVTVVT